MPHNQLGPSKGVEPKLALLGWAARTVPEIPKHMAFIWLCFIPHQGVASKMM
jgi:hypothetical protein